MESGQQLTIRLSIALGAGHEHTQSMIALPCAGHFLLGSTHGFRIGTGVELLAFEIVAFLIIGSGGGVVVEILGIDVLEVL